MTTEEFEQAKAEVIARLGEPDFDFDRSPLNQSAIEISKLRTRKRLDAKKEKQAAEGSLTDFVKDVPSETLRRAMNKALPPIFLEPHDLKGFTELEAGIIQAHFADRSLNHEQLAQRFNTNRQTVTGIFNNRSFKLLKLKYFELEAPEATRIALLHLLHDNDQKTAHRLAEHYGIIKAEKMDLNVTNKPIEDPEAEKLLRELGDKLAGAD